MFPMNCFYKCRKYIVIMISEIITIINYIIKKSLEHRKSIAIKAVLFSQAWQTITFTTYIYAID